MNTQANPYVGPRTFHENERDRFFGRKREARDLLALVVSEQLVLFYAQSGAGKSSLVNTCLIPDLKSKGFQIFTGRVAGDAPSAVQVQNIYVFNLLRSLAPKESTLDTLASTKINEFLSSAWDDTNSVSTPEEEQISKPHALIIDQFEEIFSTHQEAWEKRSNFFQQLAGAMETDPYLWVVLIMREDFIAALDPYAYLLPSRFRRRYYMQRLERHAALEAIKKPVQNLRPYAEGVAEKLVDDLCSIRVYGPDGTLDIQPGQYVEPVQLQVICYNLWENLPTEGSQITEKDLQDVGDVNTSLGNYYAGRVKAVVDAKNVSERKIREWFADKLISPGGIRNMVLQEPGGKSSGLENDVIQALPDLIRAEQRGGATFYELTHDRLVEPVIANNKKWEGEHSSPLQKQATLWNDQGRDESWLLTDQGFVEVKDWANEHPEEVTEIEKEFLESCKKLQAQIEERQEAQRQQLEIANKLAEEQRRSAQRARRFNAIAISLAVIALALAIVAGFITQRAREAEADAKTQKDTADTLFNTARARELASLANEKLDENLDLSMLLSMSAYDITVQNPKVQSIEAQNALFESTQRSARLRGFLASSDHPVYQFRFSPDGKFIAALRKNNEKKELILWNLHESLKNRVVLEDGAISQFYFSPDSKYLVSLNREGFTIWDVNNQTQLRNNINGHLGTVGQIVFNPDGQTYASLGENGNVTLWDIKDTAKSYALPTSDIVAFSPNGKKFAIFDKLGKLTIGTINVENQDAVSMEQEPDSVASMAFTPEGNFLAIARRDGDIIVWDLVNNKQTDSNFSIPQNPSIQKMAFQPNGDLMVFNSSDGIYIFDRSTGKSVSDIIPAQSVFFSPDGTMFATLGTGNVLDTGNVFLYDSISGKQISKKPFKGQLAVFSPDGNYLAISNNEDNTITLVDSRTGEPVGETFPELVSPAETMVFSGDGNLLAVGAKDGSITLWDVNNRKVRQSDVSHESPVSSLAFSPDNKKLIAGRKDSTISTWDLQTNKLEDKITNYLGHIYSVDFSPDGQFLYSTANDGASLLDAKTLAPVGPVIPGNRVQFTSDNRVMLVINDTDGETTLWNTNARKPIAQINGIFQALSPDQSVLMMGNKDGTTTLWSTRTGTRLPINDIQEKSVFFSPQGNFIYALDSASNIDLLYETSTGIAHKELIGQRLIAFSPDDKIVVTSGKEGELELRDPTTAESVLNEPIKATNVSFSRDGKYMVAYGSYNPAITTFWDIAHLRMIDKLLVVLNGDPTFSRDGWTMALNSSNSIYIWDLKTGKVMDTPFQAGSVNFSPDGKIIVFSVRNNANSLFIPTGVSNCAPSDSIDTITLWDIGKKKNIGSPLTGTFAGFNADGTFAVIKTSMGTGDLILEDATTGNQIGNPVRGQSALLGNVVLNQDGRIQAVRDEDGRISLNGGTYFIAQTNCISDTISNTAVFSPDEKTFAIFSPDGSLTLWDIYAPFLAGQTIKNFTSPVKSAMLSPDNKILAVSSEDNIALWNTENHSWIQNLKKSHIKVPYDVRLSPNGRMLVMINSDNSLSLWNTDSGEQVGNTIQEAFFGFSPDGGILVTSQSASSNGTYSFWDTTTGKLIGDRYSGNPPYFSKGGQFVEFQRSGEDSFIILKHTTDSQGNHLTQVGEPIPGSFQQFALDGKAFITSIYKDGNSVYELWNTEERTSVTVPGALWVPPEGNVAIFYSYQATTAANVSPYIFYRWDLEKREQIGDPIKDINIYSYSSDSLSLVSYVDKDHFQIWDLERGTASKPIPGSFSMFSPNNRFVAAGDSSGHTTIWDITGENISGRFNGYPWGFSTGDSGQILFSSSEEHGFVLYDVQSGHRVNDTAIPGDNIVFSPDGKMFASYSLRGSTSLWGTATGTLLEQGIIGQPFDFSLDGRVLVTTRTNEDGSEIFLWDTTVNSGKPLMEFQYPGAMDHAVMSENKKLLAVFGNAGTFLWHLTDLNQPQAVRIQDYTGQVDRMLFSQDSKTLATVGADGIILWDVTKRTQIGQTLRGQTGHIAALSFPDGGKSLVYLDTKGRIFKIDLAHPGQPGAVLDPLKGSTSACRMALSGDGSRFAYQSGKKFHIWDVKKEATSSEWEENISCDGPVAFSENGEMLAYSDGNRIYVATLNEAGKVAKIAELTGDKPFNSVTDLTFILNDQDNKILAVTADNGHIFFWNVMEHALLGTLNESGQAKLVANGKLQIYLPSENRILLIDFTPDAWKTLLNTEQSDLCAKVGRNLTAAEFLQYFSDQDFKDYKGTCPQWPVESETTANTAP